MKNYLGVRDLRRASVVMSEIESLRERSQLYSQRMERRDTGLYVQNTEIRSFDLPKSISAPPSPFGGQSANQPPASPSLSDLQTAQSPIEKGSSETTHVAQAPFIHLIEHTTDSQSRLSGCTSDARQILATEAELDFQGDCIQEPTDGTLRATDSEVLNIETYFKTDCVKEASSSDDVFQEHGLRKKHYDIERTYVQTRLKHALVQNLIVRKEGKRSIHTSVVYRDARKKRALEIVASDQMPAKLQWRSLGPTDRPEPLQLSTWFDDIDWDVRLGKYAEDGCDLELPPFGESDEEGCYSSDVMLEIDREEEERIRQSDRAAASLDSNDVLLLLTQYEMHYKRDWIDKMLPRLRSASYYLWQDHKNLDRQVRAAHIEQIKLQSKDTELRFIKYFRLITSQTFYTKRALKVQAESMRESIYQMQEQEFLLNLYNPGSACPPQPEVPVRVPERLKSSRRPDKNVSQLRVTVLDQEATTQHSSENSENDYMYEDASLPILEIDDGDCSSAATADRTDDKPSQESQKDARVHVAVSEDGRFGSEAGDENRTMESSDTEGSVISINSSGTACLGDENVPILLSSDGSETQPPISRTGRDRSHWRPQVDGEVQHPQLRSLSVIKHNANINSRPHPRDSRSQAEETLQRYRAQAIGLSVTASRFTELSPSDLRGDDFDRETFVFKSVDEQPMGKGDSAAEVSDPGGVSVDAVNALQTASNLREAEVISAKSCQLEMKDQISAAELLGARGSLSPKTSKKKKGKNKGKRKRKNFLSDSESEGDDPTRRRRKKRPVNEHALARRKRQGRERNEIISRAEEQLHAISTHGTDRVIINPGDVEVGESVEIRPSLARQLKPHQLEGVRFIWRETVMMSAVNGCLLAHTMGLGKTLQVIAYLDTLGHIIKKAKNWLPKALRRPHALILCPAALVKNWADEFDKWTPKCAMGRIFDLSMDFNNADRQETLHDWVEQGGILIMSYNIFQQLITNKCTKGPMYQQTEDADDVIDILENTARVVVADEAHHFKNERTKIGQAVRRLKTKARIALTGSPLANNLMEYWAIMDWLDAGYLGSRSDFKSEHVEVIDNGNKFDALPSEVRQGQKQLKVLLGIIGGKIDRRNLDCLRSLLPSKFEYVLFLKFHPLQREMYNSFLEAMRVHKESGSLLLLVLISRLRWICNHPSIIKSEYVDSQHLRALKRRVARSHDPNQLEIQESEQNDHAEDWRRLALTKYAESLNLDVNSAKIMLLLEICRGAKRRKDKVLVFTFSIPTIQYIKERIEHHKLGPLRILSGLQNPKNRVEDVKEFNELEGYAVCLVSTKAGGQGLNMTGANRVVLFDHEFNPVWQEQAIGRAYRMGQQKDVFVYRLQIEGSFEIQMFRQALMKLGLTSKVVDKKNISTNIKEQHSLLQYFQSAPSEDRAPNEIGEIEDQLLVEALDRCSALVLSVDKTESFHVDEANQLDEMDLLEIEAKQVAFWRDQEQRRAQYEAQQHAKSSGAPTANAVNSTPTGNMPSGTPADKA